MKLVTCLALLLFSFTVSISAQDAPLWLRYPAISPDGKSVLFEYKGDIWTVPTSGGNAIPMTLSESYEFSPVWSHDGRSIAFASDRYGQPDVFVMPATGGEAKRLTFHSAPELPSSFTAEDKAVLFVSNRQDLVTNAQFPSPAMGELYSVPVTGGRVSLVLTTMARDATVSSTGDKIIFHDYKGYESEWRKHHTSSVTRDVWVYDVGSKKYTQLSQFKGEDRNPVFDSNDNDFYYLSEQSGSFNVWKSSLAHPDKSNCSHKIHKESRSIPDTVENRDDGVQLRRRALHDERRRRTDKVERAHRRRWTRSDRKDRSGEHRIHRNESLAERKGIRIRIPRRDLC
jgi:tricorn protease-like protein